MYKEGKQLKLALALSVREKERDQRWREVWCAKWSINATARLGPCISMW